MKTVIPCTAWQRIYTSAQSTCALLLQALYGAVDLWAVGTFCGEADVSAVATGSQTMLIITGIVTGLSMGTTVLLGKKSGAVMIKVQPIR